MRYAQKFPVHGTHQPYDETMKWHIDDEKITRKKNKQNKNDIGETGREMDVERSKTQGSSKEKIMRDGQRQRQSQEKRSKKKLQ